MSSTLSEGVRVPDIGSTSWGADVNFNWGLLNTALANISGNVKVDAENTWTAPQTFTETVSGSIDGVAARAVGDEDGNNIKAALAGKQSSLSQSQLDACNSGITASAVQQIGTNADNISDLQTAVSGKAADADVVHLAGAETITGDKTFTGAVATHNVTPEANATYALGDSTKWYRDTYTNTVWVQGVRAPGTSNALILAAMETWEDGARIFMYGKDYVGGSQIYADIDHNDGNHNKTGVQLDTRGFFPAGVSRHLGLADANNRWLTFNGINPGALGMPNNSAYIDISSSISDRAYGANSFVAAATGWISIGSFATAIQIADDTAGMTIAGLPGSDGYASVFLPVRANDNIRVLINQTSTTFQSFRLLPCLGNV